MSDTTATGLPIMTSGDAPDIPADVGIKLGGALDKVTVPLFASTSARDTAYASKPFGLCFVGASVAAGTLYRRRGSTWSEVGDIGAFATSGLTWSAQTGWSVTSYAAANRAGTVHLYLQLTYSGSPITMGTDGSTGNVNVLTVPNPYRPYAPFGAFGIEGYSWNSGDMGLKFTLGGNGVLQLASGYPNATLVNGADVRINAQYAAS